MKVGSSTAAAKAAAVKATEAKDEAVAAKNEVVITIKEVSDKKLETFIDFKF